MSTADGPTDPSVVLSEEYDPSDDEPVSARIIRLVAVASDREATELEPLGQVIDVEALDELLDSRCLADPDVSVEISFRYEGYMVDIDANGTVSVLVEDE